MLRGMAHIPSVVRSTLPYLVSRTLRHAMVSLYRDFTQTLARSQDGVAGSQGLVLYENPATLLCHL